MTSEETSSRESAGAAVLHFARRRPVRMAFVVGFAFLVALRIALPFVLEWAVPRVAASQNVYAEVGNIDLGLFAGEVTLDGLVVDTLDRDPHDGAPPLLALDRGFVAFEWTGLLFDRIQITEFELDHPAIHVAQRADGSFELPVLPTQEDEATSEPTTEESESDEGPGWTILLDRFDLRNPEITLRSEALEKEVLRVGAVQLGFDALSVDADGIGLGEIELERPALFVERAWILGLAAGSGESETDPDPSGGDDLAESAAEASDGGLSAIRMRHLEIKGAEFTVSTQEGPVEVAVRVVLSDAGTEPGHTFPLELGLRVADAAIALDGSLGLNPVSFEGGLTWENLSVPPFLLLAYPKVVPWLESCDASGDLQLVYRSVADEGRPAGLEASGTSAVNAMSFRQPDSNELAIAWDALEIEFREAFVPLGPPTTEPMRFALSKLSLAAPSLVYTNPPVALDELLAALDSGATPEAAPDQKVPETSGTSAPSPIITIDAATVRDAELRYVDRGVSPRHETRIRKLRTTLEAVTTDPTPSARRIEVDGRIQSKGSFEMRGGLPDGEGEIDFSLRELDLVSYDSIARSAGVEIQSGRTSLDSTIVARGGVYRAKNELVLHDFDVALDQGNRFVDNFGMSIDVVLALLRDSSGNISLSIPVAVDADGAGVELGPIVASALRNAIQGAITSPVKMLGMLVPMGDSEASIGAIPFEAGRAQLTTDGGDRLDALVELLEKRPMLGFSLGGTWSEADREPLARRILAEKAESGGDFPEVEGDGFFARRRVGAALMARERSEAAALSAEDEALLERYVAAQSVPEERLRSLAAARAKAVRSALVELGAPETAITLAAPVAFELPSVSVELEARVDEASTDGS